MKELTTEQIARCFAMYYGATCKLCDNIEGSPVIERVSAEHVSDMATGDFNYKLLLNPISALSDEHAAILAQIIVPYTNWYELQSLGDRTTLKSEGGFKLTIGKNLNDIDNLFVVSHYSTKQEVGHGIYLRVFDKLRELGYALPFEGLDLFESGLALDASTHPESLKG